MSKYSPEFMTHTVNRQYNIGDVSKAMKNNLYLESKVVKCTEDNDLILDIGKRITGIIKFDELEYHYDGTPVKKASATSKINKHVKYRPISIEKDEDGYKVICSRKIIQEECYNNYISKLQVGDIIDAYVTKIVGYGIFCDIGCGIIALLPTNNISVTHIVNPVIELRGLSNLKVVVKEIHEDGKIELSHKELIGTWEQEAAKFNVGECVTGTVLSVEEYGVFVRISQNIAGLAEIPNIDVKVGDIVSVKIISIQKLNMKVKLLIFDVVDNIENKPLRFKYYMNTGHLKYWKYSTDTAKRQIESHFEYKE